MEHTHRLSFSGWVGGLGCGSLITIMGLFMLLSSLGILPVEEPSALEYIGIALVAILMLPVGVAMVCNPLITRVVVRPSGIEFHTINYVLRAEWKELRNCGYFNVPNTGKTLVVVPEGGQLAVRNWTRPLWSIFRVSNPRNVQIFVSLFGLCEGHSLEDDIIANVLPVNPLADRCSASQ